MTKENQIEEDLVQQLTELKYTHRPDIIDRKTLEQNFKAKLEEERKGISNEIIQNITKRSYHLLHSWEKIPSIEKQKIFVTIFHTLATCKCINEQLQEKIKPFCPVLMYRVIRK